MTLHICWTEPHEEVSRRPDGVRYCFVCRKRCGFDLLVSAPVEPSYYGPMTRIECTVCKTADGDVFPGRTREWVES